MTSPLFTRARAERWMAEAAARTTHNKDVAGYLARYQQLCQEQARADRTEAWLLAGLAGLLSLTAFLGAFL